MNKNIPRNDTSINAFVLVQSTTFAENNAYGYVVRGKFIDIGTPETYKITDKYLKEIC